VRLRRRGKRLGRWQDGEAVGLWLALCALNRMSPHTLKPLSAPKLRRGLLADVYPPLRAPLHVPVRGCDRQLQSDETRAADVSLGSGPANQSAELVARNLPVELGCHRADVRLDRVPTPCCRSRPAEPVVRDRCSTVRRDWQFVHPEKRRLPPRRRSLLQAQRSIGPLCSGGTGLLAGTSVVGAGAGRCTRAATRIRPNMQHAYPPHFSRGTNPP